MTYFLSSRLVSKNCRLKYVYRTSILSVVFCGCETWCLTFRKKQTKDIFQEAAEENIWAREGGITDTSRLTQCQVTQFQAINFIKAKIKLNTNIFKTPNEFFLARMTAQLDEHGLRLLLGDNKGGGEVMLRPIRFQCVGVWMSVCLPFTYIYS